MDLEHISHFHFFLGAVLSTVFRMGTSILKGEMSGLHYTRNQTQITLAGFLRRSTSTSEHITYLICSQVLVAKCRTQRSL